jgi:ATP-dependent Clp protease ATP-binding subunit ClpA
MHLLLQILEEGKITDSLGQKIDFRNTIVIMTFERGRRAVEKYLEDPLAEEFLRGNIKQGDTLDVHTAGQQLAFKVAGAGTG